MEMAKDRGKRGPANAAPLRSEDECTPASLGRPPLKRQARGRAVRTYCATWSTDYEHGWDLRLPEYVQCCRDGGRRSVTIKTWG